MPLRKVLLTATALTNNARSFVNVTDKRLHIRKVVGRARPSSTPQVLGDIAFSTLDEVPIATTATDSRQRIAIVIAVVSGGTGALVVTQTGMILAFNRGDLYLDTDEALYQNNTDITGAPAVSFEWNIWYED